MSDRVDLDAAEALFRAGHWAASIQHARRRTGLALIAELKVAREVVEGVRNHRRVYLTPSQLRAHEATCGDCRRLAAYDQHADPSTHDRSGSG